MTHQRTLDDVYWVVVQSNGRLMTFAKGGTALYLVEGTAKSLATRVGGKAVAVRLETSSEKKSSQT